MYPVVLLYPWMIRSIAYTIMASSAIPGRVGAARTALQEVDATGGFVRRSSVYRDVISQGGKYPPESTCIYIDMHSDNVI